MDGEERELVRSLKGKSKGARPWVSCAWTARMDLVSSGLGGEMWAWSGGGRGYRWGNHRRPVFALVPVGDRHVLSVSMDRSVVLWRLETWDVEWSAARVFYCAQNVLSGLLVF